jgi:hypothetical protein
MNVSRNRLKIIGFLAVLRIRLWLRDSPDEAIMGKYVSCSIAAALAVATTLGAVKTSTAAAFPVDTYTAKSVASDVVEVRHGGGIVAGIGLGLLGAAIVGNSYYYGPGYYPAYYPGYSYPPYPYYGPYSRPYWGYPAYPRYRYYRHYRRHW